LEQSRNLWHEFTTGTKPQAQIAAPPQQQQKPSDKARTEPTNVKAKAQNLPRPSAIVSTNGGQNQNQ
jgi:hypothetical protein